MVVGADLAPGATLASYTIESVLGRGGMGVVYAAFDARLGRRVALKLLGASDGSDPALRERFLRESRLAASLDHPNVIPIYEAGEADGSLFIAMRLVRGTDLRGLLAREGPLEPARALAIISQTAGALDAAHALGLLHRDIKPGNILLARDERGGEHVYLSDFGLAIPRSVEGALEQSRFQGTAEYAAPEQIQGQPEARSDIYSLACVLFECLAGEPPFGRKRMLATLWSHVNEAAPRLTERRPELPSAVDDVLSRALAKEPQVRYGTGVEFVSAARSALGLERPRAGGRRALGFALTAVAAAVAAAVALVLTTVDGERPAAVKGGVISTFAGTGEPGVSGDGGPATEAQLDEPWDIAVSTGGTVHIAQAGSASVRRVTRDGTITTVAGTGEPGYSGDGGPATEAQITAAVNLGVDRDGQLNILQFERPALRRIDDRGVIETIAGTGMPGYLADSTRTRSRDLCVAPVAPAFDPAGRIFIACYSAHRVIRVEPDGSYRTIAGTGKAGYSGDGGPATAAQLNRPIGIAFDRDGNLYIADSLNNRVRKVDPNGIISTVAGTGHPGHSGDGWRADTVDIWSPVDVAIDARGNLYIVEHATHRVRKVDRDGIMTTIAGTGVPGFQGDGGPAVEAALNSPESVGVDAAGNVYIADRGNQRIRVVRP